MKLFDLLKFKIDANRFADKKTTCKVVLQKLKSCRRAV